MKFKYGDKVMIEDEFYGTREGTIIAYEHDGDSRGIDHKTGRLIHSKNCYSYLVETFIDHTFMTIKFTEDKIKLK